MTYRTAPPAAWHTLPPPEPKLPGSRRDGPYSLERGRGLSVTLLPGERDRFVRWCAERGVTVTEGLRRLIYDAMGVKERT